ncbi:MAG: lipoate--protein ligase family protein [Verrucomicrobiae bacterium]|nr:lipoate--protein ligase family protein [Verrucomicrobiae bacterium]
MESWAFLDQLREKDRGSPAVNMATDEWLLRHAVETGPTLRIYRWDRPAFSFGYGQSSLDAPAGIDAVRRPTGGGRVDHRADATYAIALPRGHAIARLGGCERYRALHELVLELFKAREIAAALADSCDGAGRGDFACFERPARFDVIGAHGLKLGGGAQRLSRTGLLHQGSLQLSPAPSADEWRRALRARGIELRDWTLPTAGSVEIERLAQSKYSRDWRALSSATNPESDPAEGTAPSRARR